MPAAIADVLPAPPSLESLASPTHLPFTQVPTKRHHDGRVKHIDLSAKLVVIMVGLPARGKSYTTEKLARYLNMVFPTSVFNVGKRRRTAAGGQPAVNAAMIERDRAIESGRCDLVHSAAKRLQNEEDSHAPPKPAIDQSAKFFDPDNTEAAKLRDQVAMETLTELLDYLMTDDGCVGIFDATNSTIKRRKMVLDHIRQRAGPAINVLFIENVCNDNDLIRANMLLKLQGPDYKGTDPQQALEDFANRIKNYERSYEPIGVYERENHISFIRVIDAGSEIERHLVSDVLSLEVFKFLKTFHLSPRAIWITRHGESIDNTVGKVGGDSSLSEKGERYAAALAPFIHSQRREWEIEQLEMEHKAATCLPRAGDMTPPNPYVHPPALCTVPGGVFDEPITPPEDQDDQKCSCPPSTRQFHVMTSKMHRSLETASGFEYPHWIVRSDDRLNPRKVPVAAYDQSSTDFPCTEQEVEKTFFARYPRPGGDIYVDTVNRAGMIIGEIEKMKDHCLVISHRSIVRVLLGYFCGLSHDKVAELDCPLGYVWRFVPRPYGLMLSTYKYDDDRRCFDLESTRKVN